MTINFSSFPFYPNNRVRDQLQYAQHNTTLSALSNIRLKIHSNSQFETDML